jgi:hypothetical protein
LDKQRQSFVQHWHRTAEPRKGEVARGKAKAELRAVRQWRSGAERRRAKAKQMNNQKQGGRMNHNAAGRETTPQHIRPAAGF